MSERASRGKTNLIVALPRQIGKSVTAKVLWRRAVVDRETGISPAYAAPLPPPPEQEGE